MVFNFIIICYSLLLLIIAIILGHGIFLYADGDVYEGSFKDDMRDGFGILKSKTNGSIYTGEWSRNYRNGKGTLTLPDGVVYEGQFKDNIYIPN